MKKTSTLVWAVDPFSEHFRDQEAVLRALNFAATDTLEVQPVYVWSGKKPAAKTTSEEISDEVAMERIQQEADGILSRWASPKLSIPLRSARILHSQSSSFSDHAKAVVECAKKLKAPLILACHSRRSGVEKWFSNSFCESLSLISDVSVLIIPEEFTPRPRAKNILFSTDFSAESSAAFDRVLDFARERDWGVTVFHNIEYPNYPAVDFVYASTDAVTDVEEELVSEAHRHSDLFCARGNARGVKTTCVVDESRHNHAGLAVNRELENGYSLVAVAAHSGTMQRLFVGSTSRFLIRECALPVWIMRPIEVSLSEEIEETPLSNTHAAQSPTSRGFTS